MTQETMIQGPLQKFGIALGSACAVASGSGWILLVILVGDPIPRATLIAAVFAVALAVTAYRAVRSQYVWILLPLAFVGAVTPPTIGSAPESFRYLGFLAIGYAIAAMFLIAPRKPHRRAS